MRWRSRDRTGNASRHARPRTSESTTCCCVLFTFPSLLMNVSGRNRLPGHPPVCAHHGQRRFFVVIASGAGVAGRWRCVIVC